MKYGHTIIWGVLLCLCCGTALARQEDGSLGLLRFPHDGAPAVVAQGDTFPVTALERVALELVMPSRSLPMAVTWNRQREGLWEGEATLPGGLAAGLYGIEASHGGLQDRTPRAVCVQADAPASYVIAHLGGLRVTAPPSNAQKAVLSAAGHSEAALILLTGDLTAHGRSDEFQALLTLLAKCCKPTVLSPGGGDLAGGCASAYLGAAQRAFRFGRDGYLLFDTSRPNALRGSSQAVGLLQQLRREIKAVRWATGITWRYDTRLGARGQLALFVDNPLDFLLVSEGLRGESPEAGTVPWGKTSYGAPPLASEGGYLLLDVGFRGIVPRAPEQALFAAE